MRYLKDPDRHPQYSVITIIIAMIIGTGASREIPNTNCERRGQELRVSLLKNVGFGIRV